MQHTINVCPATVFGFKNHRYQKSPFQHLQYITACSCRAVRKEKRTISTVNAYVEGGSYVTFIPFQMPDVYNTASLTTDLRSAGLRQSDAA